MTHAAPVVVIGDALIDELRDDLGVREFVGGAALNVAVGLARLGLSATLIAMVGDDEAGDHIREYLGDYGVRLIASPSRLGTARAVSTRGPGGEPTYEFNEAAQNRRIRFSAEAVAAIAEAEMTVLSCVRLDDPEQTADFVAALGSAKSIAIDPNPRAGMLADRDEFVRGLEQIATAADLVKIGDDDAVLLYGRSLEPVRERLVALGARAVLATAGASGAAVQVGDMIEVVEIVSLPGRIIDTMGAGDATLSATVAAMIDSPPSTPEQWREVLVRAMTVAAATCRAEGALLRIPGATDDDELNKIGT